MNIVAGQMEEKAYRISDRTFYEKMYFDERLKDDTHKRMEEALKVWKAEGSDPTQKPLWLSHMHATTRNHWDQETPEFRAQVQEQNAEDYKRRKAEADTANKALNNRSPVTPEDHAA